MKSCPLFMIGISLIALILLSGMVSAAKVTLSSGQVAGPGDEITLHLVLDEAPDGLAGYFVNISFDRSIAQITNVVYPSWAGLKNTRGLDGGNDVELSAIDVKKEIQAGAKNIELATITLKGVKAGSTTLHLKDDIVDSDTKGHMERLLVDGQLTVGDSPSLLNQMSSFVPDAGSESPADNPKSAETVSQASPGDVKPKGTYVPLEVFVPVLGILISILIIGIGGQQKRG